MRRATRQATRHSHPHVQNFILKQIEQLRVPATDLLAMIDETLSLGSLGPTQHFSWCAIVSLLDSVEADLWHSQIGTNNHQTPYWPNQTALGDLTYYSFKRLEPIYEFVNADLSRVRGEKA